nr:MAG: RNA-dependent RNA polymerase [Porcine picobirnavirus]
MIVETRLQDYFDLPNPNLLSQLGRNETGQPEIITTPFFKGVSTGDILAKWDRCLKAADIPRKYPGMYKFEEDLRAKVGPMSVIRPFSARQADVESYYTGVQLPSKPISDNALSAVLDLFGNSNHIRLKSQEKVWEDLDSKSRSAGAPMMVSKRKAIDKTLPAVFSAPDLLQTPNWHGHTACIMFSRGQEGGPEPADTKNRVIWGAPLGEILAEGQFYQPKIALKKSLPEFPHLRGGDAVDERCTGLLTTKNPRDLVVCTDFDKYDQHYNENMQNFARQINAHLLGGVDHPWLENVFPAKFSIPIVCTKSVTFKGKHGMASGSYGTNDDETDSHTGLQFEAAQAAHETLNEYSQRNGDDGALSYPGITVKQVVTCYTQHGMEMNVSKQWASNNDMVYLRNWHSLDYKIDGICRGVYSTFRALGRLRYQERYYDPEHWGPEMVTLRAWSILENCKWHPLFEPLVDYVMEKGDKFQLGLKLDGFMENVSHIAMEAMDNFSDFLGYNKTIAQTAEQAAKGIKNWAIYQYLMSKKKR